MLFGAEMSRALVTPPGATAACPLYVPGVAGSALPMFAAFEARLTAEVHAAQDQAEAHAVALRALALGRAMATGKTRVS